MPRLLVDPLNLNPVLVGIAALTSAAYFILVRDKSAATWFMLGFLLFWALFELTRGLWVFSHAALAADGAFVASPLGIATIVAGALAGPMLVQAAYYFRSSPYPREAKVVLVVSLATVAACPLLFPSSPPLTVASGRWVIALWALWGAVVLLRKRRRAAEMAREKIEKLESIAPVGFEGFRGHPPLGAEMAKPAGDFGCHIGRYCGGKAHKANSGTAFFTLP